MSLSDEEKRQLQQDIAARWDAHSASQRQEPREQRRGAWWQTLVLFLVFLAVATLLWWVIGSRT